MSLLSDKDKDFIFRVEHPKEAAMQDLKRKRQEYNDLFERRMNGTIDTDDFLLLEKTLMLECAELKQKVGIFMGAETSGIKRALSAELTRVAKIKAAKAA